MPITTQWYDDRKQIILVIYEGNYGWNDVYKCADATNALADEVNCPVANIIDMTKAGGIPPNAASNAKRLRARRNPKIQFEVVVGATASLRTMARVANAVFKIFTKESPTHFVDTLDDALNLIETAFIRNEPQ
jgi:hypothetical protein